MYGLVGQAFGWVHRLCGVTVSYHAIPCMNLSLCCCDEVSQDYHESTLHNKETYTPYKVIDVIISLACAGFFIWIFLACVHSAGQKVSFVFDRK